MLEFRVQAAIASFEKEKSLHANTAFHCQELQAELKNVKWKASELEERRKILLADREEMKNENEQLKKGNLAMHDKLKIIISTHITLEKEFTDYKAHGPLLTEALKQQVYQEYRRSPELSKEVIQQFDGGCQSAQDKDKAKMLAMVLDPSIVEAEDDPPPQ